MLWKFVELVGQKKKSCWPPLHGELVIQERTSKFLSFSGAQSISPAVWWRRNKNAVFQTGLERMTRMFSQKLRWIAFSYVWFGDQISFAWRIAAAPRHQVAEKNGLLAEGGTRWRHHHGHGSRWSRRPQFSPKLSKINQKYIIEYIEVKRRSWLCMAWQCIGFDYSPHEMTHVSIGKRRISNRPGMSQCDKTQNTFWGWLETSDHIDQSNCVTHFCPFSKNILKANVVQPYRCSSLADLISSTLCHMGGGQDGAKKTGQHQVWPCLNAESRVVWYDYVCNMCNPVLFSNGCISLMSMNVFDIDVNVINVIHIHVSMCVFLPTAERL